MKIKKILSIIALNLLLYNLIGEKLIATHIHITPEEAFRIVQDSFKNKIPLSEYIACQLSPFDWEDLDDQTMSIIMMHQKREFEAQLKEKNEIIQKLKEQLAEKDKAMAEKDKILEQNKQQIQRQKKLLKKQDQILKKQKQLLNDQRLLLKQQDQQLKELDRQLKEKDQQLREKDAEIEKLNRKLAHRELIHKLAIAKTMNSDKKPETLRENQAKPATTRSHGNNKGRSLPMEQPLPKILVQQHPQVAKKLERERERLLQTKNELAQEKLRVDAIENSQEKLEANIKFLETQALANQAEKEWLVDLCENMLNLINSINDETKKQSASGKNV